MVPCQVLVTARVQVCKGMVIYFPWVVTLMAAITYSVNTFAANSHAHHCPDPIHIRSGIKVGKTSGKTKYHHMGCKQQKVDLSAKVI